MTIQTHTLLFGELRMSKFKLIGAAVALTISSAAFAAIAADCCPDMVCCKDSADPCGDSGEAKGGDHAAPASAEQHR